MYRLLALLLLCAPSALADQIRSDGTRTIDAQTRLELRVDGGNILSATATSDGTTGQLNVHDGTTALPGLAFSSQPANGLTRTGSNTFQLRNGSGNYYLLKPSGAEIQVGSGDSVGQYVNGVLVTSTVAAGMNIDGVLTQSGTGGDTPHDCAFESSSTTSTTHIETCSGTKVVLGGGCFLTAGSIMKSWPFDANTWKCEAGASTSITVYALCCEQ